MDFEYYSKIDTDANNVSPVAIGDVDTSPLKDQKKIRYTQDTEYRKHLTRWIMHIVPIWLLGVFVIICMCASKVWWLSDITFSALLTTTTANILGLAYIVLKGMFPPGKE
jgi:hypothetical protein